MVVYRKIDQKITGVWEANEGNNNGIGAKWLESFLHYTTTKQPPPYQVWRLRILLRDREWLSSFVWFLSTSCACILWLSQAINPSFPQSPSNLYFKHCNMNGGQGIHLRSASWKMCVSPSKDRKNISHWLTCVNMSMHHIPFNIWLALVIRDTVDMAVSSFRVLPCVHLPKGPLNLRFAPVHVYIKQCQSSMLQRARGR